MSRFVDTQIVREDLGDGDWVDVRAGILWREMLDVFGPGDPGTTEGRASRAMAGLIRIGIVAWGGPGFEGLPFGPEAIARLRLEDVAHLARLVGERNPDVVGTPSPKEPAAESGGSDSSSPAVAT